MDEETLKVMTQIYDMMASPQFGKAIASMYHNVYSELVTAGFTPKQAMDIVTKAQFGNK